MTIPRRLLLPVVLLTPGSNVFAQVIITGPVNSVPTLSEWSMLMLVLLMLVCAGRAIRKGQARTASAMLVLMSVSVLLFNQGAALWAAVTADFTNPGGETLPIPVVQIIAGADTAGWELADYNNVSNNLLRVQDIVLPTGAQCLAGGLTGSLLPAGAPPPAPPPDCNVGQILSNGNSCRVDVDTTCRALVAGILPTLASITANSGPAAGGTGFTLTGTNLTGTTSITFDGIPATSVNVVNSTTVTAVSPAHAIGVVDVVIATPQGGATLNNSFTYIATAVGLPSGGGIIAGLAGGLNNLIAAHEDNSPVIEWGGFGILTNAISVSDGAANTTIITAVLGGNGGVPYAAQACAAYEVDSQGNTPCQPGNACYNDWFVPAFNQVNVLYTNRVAIGGFAGASYWGSTEDDPFDAYLQQFVSGIPVIVDKNDVARLRCTRAFTP